MPTTESSPTRIVQAELSGLKDVQIVLLTQNVGGFDVEEHVALANGEGGEGGGAGSEAKGGAKGGAAPLPSSIRRDVMEWIRNIAALIEFETQPPANAPSGTPPREIDVLVLNIQETGGKKYSGAFNQFLASVIHQAYPAAAWCSGLLMSDRNDDLTFTAMGSVIWVSNRLFPITSFLSYRHRTYVALADDDAPKPGQNSKITSPGIASSAADIQKALTANLHSAPASHHRYYGGKFCNAEKSRKGYLLTSLRVGTRILNFVNVHMFHDNDNCEAAAHSPSTYAPRRSDALVEAITEISPLTSMDDPLFIFGDFNFRLDGRKVCDYLQEKFSCTVEVGKKKFKPSVAAAKDFLTRADLSIDILRQFDQEGPPALEAVSKATGFQLAELPRPFPPTYLFKAANHDSSGSPLGDFRGKDANPSSGNFDVESPKSGLAGARRPYCLDRMPSWCDRVLMNPRALAMTLAPGRRPPPGPGEHKYASIQLSAALDHDAVFLRFGTDCV